MYVIYGTYMCCIYALHICGIYVGIYVDIYDDIYVTYMYVPYGKSIEVLSTLGIPFSKYFSFKSECDCRSG